MTETTDLGRTVVVVRWPDLQASATVEVGVLVQVSAQMVMDRTIISPSLHRVV